MTVDSLLFTNAFDTMRTAMSYTNRISAAALASILLHLAAVATFAYLAPRGAGPAVLPSEPLVVNLEPPREAPVDNTPQEDRRLIDVVTPADTPPEDAANLIAEQNSRAQDTELRDGDDEGPITPQADDFEALARMPQPQPDPAPRPQPEPPAEPEQPRPEPAEEPAHTGEEPIQEARLRQPQSDGGLRAAPENPEEAPELESLKEQPKPDQPDDPLQLAQAMPQAKQDESYSKARSRVHDSITEKGFTNFTAIQDEIAPYLREIRNRVEREWRHMLLTRYSGTSPTKATIDCAISADGKLVSVKVVGFPDDRVYAALCRQAVEKAGPFSPFPFEVPDLYRSKNLEIRWTFGFL